jgi:hypothetical protein
MAKRNNDSNMWAKIGVWSFVVGVVIAVLIALFTLFGRGTGMPAWTVVVLAILGLIVGLLNIGADEVNRFLLASIAFVIAAASMATVFAQLGSSFDWLQAFMSAIAVFAAPAALVVAFKALYEVAKDD